MNIFTKWLMKKANDIIASRSPDFKIGPPEDPYMLRWWAIPRNRWFNIYIHLIRHDDDDRALHDHPWPSLSLMVTGRLIEHYQDDDELMAERVIQAGDWVYRKASFAHRLERPKQSGFGPITIFITGPRIREWGFKCPQGWRHWKDFVGMNIGEVGRGCGEYGITDDLGLDNHFHCRECGAKETMMHNYDGYCRDCVESSPYGREKTALYPFFLGLVLIVSALVPTYIIFN